MNRYNVIKKRCPGLDLFRAFCACMIFAYHSENIIDIHYGSLNSFVEMGAVFMTAFFMLSGYALFLNHAGNNLSEKQNIKSFYIRRFTSIMPMYLLCGLIFTLTPLDQDTLLKRIAITPAEILGLQADLPGLFDHSHNGMTWFISCLIFCYLIYPFLQELIKMMSYKHRKQAAVLCIFILFYAPFLQLIFETESIYASPFLRMLEFILGILLASFLPDLSQKQQRFYSSRITACMTCFILFFGITAAVKLNINPGNYMLYSLIGIPCFSILLLCMTCIPIQKEPALLKNFCACSYAFFLGQLWSIDLAELILNKLKIQADIPMLLITWSIGILTAVILHQIEKTLTAWCRKKLSVHS